MLTRMLARVNGWFARRTDVQRLAIAFIGVGLISYVDTSTGYEASVGLFYIARVAIAAWYIGRWSGVVLAVTCSIAWYIADIGHPYSHPVIQVWNALIRLGFFLVSSLLLSTLRASLLKQSELARKDSLTGLLTRRAFEDVLEHDLALAQRTGQPITLAYVDLDDFKRINDETGHAEGDRVLRTVADVLRRVVRRADTLARMGGDEFVLVMPNTDEHGARRVVTSVTEELAATLRVGGREYTCSVGVMTFLDASVSVEKAVAAADELMYEVKRNRKGSVRYAVGKPAAVQTRAQAATSGARG